ncbi:MAG: ATP-binding domain-containing protein [Myxococcota bacterium]|nr:ATP-binding domain-containing protein [Myxococcota bacterium]
MLARYGWDIPEPKIVLTTIHGSKGRQKDTVVFITEIDNESAKALKSRDKADDEYRLMYVAVTRTKNHLVLVAPTASAAFPVIPIYEALPPLPEPPTPAAPVTPAAQATPAPLASDDEPDDEDDDNEE